MTGTGESRLVRGEASSQRATFLELFFDLVFVFALTRVSQRLITELDADRPGRLFGLGQTILLLLGIWLVWSFTALTTSRLDPDRSPLQIVVVFSMLGALVMVIAMPEAFEDRGLLFAGAYVAIQIGRPLFLRLVNAAEAVISNRLIFWLGLSAMPWLLGAFVGPPWARAALWTLAIGLDYTGLVSGWPTPRLGRWRLPGRSLAGEHLAERYQQFLLITLGESILVFGTTFSGTRLDLDRSVAFLLSFLTTVLLWRAYFHRAGRLLAAAMTNARRPDALGLALSHTHLVMVAAIVLTSVGYELFIEHPRGEVPLVWLAAILGGPMLFLAGNGTFVYQLLGRVSWPRIGGLVAMGLLVPAAVHLPPLAVGATAAVVLAAVVGVDAILYRGRAPGPPTPPA
ncbi:low temperature requirement protein A [Micromonospora musae]|uniref:low temperature requirement protein A n=1 Tax=Micromonospora musae TaxID=1894970 RepID=UPI0033CE8E77